MNYISIHTDRDVIREHLDHYLTPLKKTMHNIYKWDVMRKKFAVYEIVDKMETDDRPLFDVLTDMSKEYHGYAHIAPTPRQVVLFTVTAGIIDDCIDVLRAKGESK